MTDDLLIGTLVTVVASFGAVALLVRLRFSPIVGYLAAGIIVGPHGLALLQESEGVRFLGELGVVLLMFIVGLEFSLPRLIATRHIVFGMGGLQVGVTTAVVAAAGWFLGLGWLASFLLGGAVAMSSTAITLKQLAEQGELNDRHGRLTLGILLFQDLAALPFLVMIGAFRARGGQPDALAVAAQIPAAVGSFLVITLLARHTLARLIEWVARSRSAELFLLAVLAEILIAAYVAGEIGLSLPIGAFLVGMIIGESDFRHQVEDEIRPFRDVLLGIFFLTVGMALDLHAIVAAPLVILGSVLLLVMLKALIVFFIGLGAGWPAIAALRAGVVLAHCGEFALLIVTQALTVGLIDTGLGQITLAAVTISMALAPILIQWNGRLAAFVLGNLASQAPQEDERAIAKASAPLDQHVILCGCGRVGRLVATAFETLGVPYIAIEVDIVRLRRAERQGHRVVFGDATRYAILKAAGIERAQAIVVTIGNRTAVERLLRRVRHNFPTLPVIVSTSDEDALQPLVDAGATRILPENLAAGLVLTAQTLLAIGLSPEEVEDRINQVRTSLSPELRGCPPLEMQEPRSSRGS